MSFAYMFAESFTCNALAKGFEHSPPVLTCSQLAMTRLYQFSLFLACEPPHKAHRKIQVHALTVSRYERLGWNAASDLSLALWPIAIVRRLQIPLKKKIGVCALMGMGVVAAALSIARAVEAAKAMFKNDQGMRARSHLWHSTDANGGDRGPEILLYPSTVRSVLRLTLLSF